ncbi:MAG: glycosyltransferase [Bacteroidales bacterium]|nr:glycosyltransferase [Bacteroidales bacterium]
MKLSIIIPAYNAEAYLPQCLDSILAQEHQDCEVIVVDDGSTDGTAALLERYPDVKVVHQKNRGMSTARNRGLDEARGEYILFVDSDDLLTDGALETLVAELSGEDIIAFNAKKLHDATGELTYHPTIREPETTDGWTYFCRHRLEATDIHFVCIWQRAYRRQFLIDNNLRFADGILRAEDDLFTTQAMLAAKTLRTITPCLYIYRIRANSITTTVDRRRFDDSLRVQRRLADLFIPLQGVDKKVIYRVLASNYINLFSRKTKNLYGNIDREMKRWVDWRQFRTVCLTPRHRRLYHLIRIHPSLFRFYELLTR